MIASTSDSGPLPDNETKQIKKESTNSFNDTDIHTGAVSDGSWTMEEEKAVTKK